MIAMWAVLALAQVVAVLPFQDAAAPTHNKTAQVVSPLAEGLRAVIAADLAAVPGLTVGDRGARLRVTGAYQRTATELKLWARFYRSNGKLNGTATVLGPPDELLELAGRIESRILRRLKMPRETIAQLTYRVRPRLRSVRAVERFGAALQATGEARQHLLELALDDDPTFVYAARALDALDRKLPPRDPEELGWEERASADALVRWRAEVAASHDPARLAGDCLARFAKLQKERRFRLLVAEARAVMAAPPPPVPSLSEQLPESAEYLIVASYDQLNEDDALLREGQKYLARYPLSNGFVVVRQLVDGAIARQKERDAGKAQVAKALARLSPAERADSCRLANLYFDEHQLADARGRFQACLADGRPHPDALVRLVWTEYRLGHFAEVVRLLERIRVQAPARYRQVMQLTDELPVD